MAIGSGWNLWVWLVGYGCNLWVWLVSVLARRYIYNFLILLNPYTSFIVFFTAHPYFLFIF